MNRCRALIGLILLGVLSAGVAVGGTLPAAVVSGNASAPGPTKQIQDFIDQQTAALADESKPTAQQAARDALIGEVVGALQPSSSFLDVYAKLLNKALLPLTKSDSMRVRLNVAIVAARVAQRVETIGLEEVAEALVKDDSAAVVLWGVKAAGGVIPSVLRIPLLAGKDHLMQEVVAAVKKHPAGAITQAAYDALSLGVVDSRSAAVEPAMLKLTLPRVLELLTLRVQQYIHHTPTEPSAENRATLFLADRRVWSVASAAQRVEIVQLLTQLLSVSAQRASAGTSHREQLVPVIQQTASALWVMADYLKSPALQAAATPLIKLGINTPGTQIMQDVAAVEQAVRGIAGYDKVKPAPVVGKEEEPATAPAPSTTFTTAPSGK
jgi:hypothetical protein